ncbi:MAG: purine-cytosine permease family protein, partial [Actinomycetota bacterium]
GGAFLSGGQMASVKDRLGKVLREEGASWDVRPTSPDVRRLSGVDFGILWGDLGVGMLVIVAGALLVPALGLPEALLAVLVGSVLGCLPLALVGVAGAREGVPGMVLLRPVLGVWGSYAPTALNVGQLVGWTAFELWAMALIASRVTGPLFGVESFWIWLGVAAIVCVALSLGGPVLVVRRWMERFGAWVIGGVAAWITFRLLVEADLGALWSRPAEGGFPTFWQGVDLVVALPVSWIPLVADYSRFARRGVSSAGGTYLGYLVANVWFYAIGALLVLGAGVPAFPGPAAVGEGILTLAGGTIVLLALLVGETDEAFADIYSAAVSIQNVARRAPVRALVVGVSALGVALAAWLFGQPDDGVQTYELFLFLIGSVFVPLTGVFIADYFALGRQRFASDALFDPSGPYRYTGGVRLAAIGAWILGFLAFQWVFPTGPGWWTDLVIDIVGKPLFGGNVSASLVSFGVAFVAYLAMAAGISARPRERAEARSPQG